MANKIVWMVPMLHEGADEEMQSGGCTTSPVSRSNSMVGDDANGAANVTVGRGITENGERDVVSSLVPGNGQSPDEGDRGTDIHTGDEDRGYNLQTHSFWRKVGIIMLCAWSCGTYLVDVGSDTYLVSSYTWDGAYLNAVLTFGILAFSAAVVGWICRQDM